MCRLRQKSRTSAIPTPTSTIPSPRPGVRWCSLKPTQPNWSTRIDASACPVMIAAVSVDRAELRRRDDRAGDVEGAEQAADPDPPGNVAEPSGRRQRLAHERREDEQDDRPDEERHERGADGAAEPVRELRVDPELERQHRAGGDGEEQVEPDHCSRRFRRVMLAPSRGALVRSHRPARSAVRADDRADAVRRAAGLRVRVDVRLAHPLAGLVRDARARRGADGRRSSSATS